MGVAPSVGPNGEAVYNGAKRDRRLEESSRRAEHVHYLEEALCRVAVAPGELVNLFHVPIGDTCPDRTPRRQRRIAIFLGGRHEPAKIGKLRVFLLKGAREAR